jgi:hypothetical protein
VGPAFVSGTAALGFLLAAEVVAAMAAVSEAALIYVARHRNMLISLLMLALEAGLAVLLILGMRQLDVPILWQRFLGIRGSELPTMWQATSPAIALMLALGFAAVVKSRLLCGILGARVNGWRWPLVWAAAAGTAVGVLSTYLPEWAELLFGIPGILLAFGAVLWTKGFGSQDRELFRMKKADIDELQELEIPAPGTTGDAVR